MQQTTQIRNRFKDASWFDSTESLLVGGAGGIGTWFTFFASRAGHDIYLFDDDLVEEHNLGGQLFNKSHIGKKKVKAIQSICKEFSDHEITVVDEKYTPLSDANHIMVGAFDNMEARKIFYDKWKAHVLSLDENMRYKCLLIDGRLEAETWQIYCVTPERMEAYENEALFTDAEVTTEASCTLKQTSHIAAHIGASMLNFLNNFLSNVKVMKNIRKVPFFTAYASAINYHKSR